MPNIIEAAGNLIRSFVDTEPKTPLHVGEVMSCWTYMAVLQEALAFEKAGLNTSTQSDLCQSMKDGVTLCKSQIERLHKFMISEGIPIPPLGIEKPDSNAYSVPYGVKATDDELANGMSAKVAGAVVMCASSASQSVRNDVGMMFFEFQTEMMTYGTSLKSLLRKHGWLKIPPYFTPPGIPHQ